MLHQIKRGGLKKTGRGDDKKLVQPHDRRMRKMMMLRIIVAKKDQPSLLLPRAPHKKTYTADGDNGAFLLYHYYVA